MIDMHCHVDLYSDPHKIIELCRLHEVYVLSITTTPKAWIGTTRLAQNYQRIQTALGLHPQLAHERYKELSLFDQLLPEAKYIGEIGLDGGKHLKQHQETQVKVFKHILSSLSNAGGKTMSIHSYKSADAVISILKEFPNSGVPILHWFTGNLSELRDAIRLGCWFSVNPMMLSSKGGRSLIEIIPRNRILPETDGPFAKYKGQILMPWQSNIVYQQLTQLWNMDSNDVKNNLFNNFKELVSHSKN